MKIKLILLIFTILFFSSFVFAQELKTITITQEEQGALTNAYIRRQQTQQRLDEQKKLTDSLLQILQASIKNAEVDDQNAVMSIQNITLKIANTHGFDPEKYSVGEKDGKLVFNENPKPKEKEKEKKGE